MSNIEEEKDQEEEDSSNIPFMAAKKKSLGGESLKKQDLEMMFSLSIASKSS